MTGFWGVVETQTIKKDGLYITNGGLSIKNGG
jgi:hypothetical protein